MVQFHTAIKDKKSVRANSIHGAEDGTKIAWILRQNQSNCSVYRF